SVRAQEPENLTPADLERDPLHSLEFGIKFLQIAHRNNRIGVCHICHGGEPDPDSGLSDDRQTNALPPRFRDKDYDRSKSNRCPAPDWHDWCTFSPKIGVGERTRGTLSP